jgi:hypothetical protein
MRRILPVLLAAACVLPACKSSTPSSTSSTSPAGAAGTASTNDAVSAKLADIAGSGATNCGRLATQGTSEMEAASKCAMQAAQQKHPFHVAYDMPGMTVGVAGNPEGKLFALQSQTGGAGLTTEPCPAELRVAPSGRVTCYAPGTFPMGAGSGSHSNMSMPAGMTNPHQQGAGAQSNPHQSGTQKPPQ